MSTEDLVVLSLPCTPEGGGGIELAGRDSKDTESDKEDSLLHLEMAN